ncbi:MAG TPA: dipeptide ABC transporter ATP-binding protein [Desulfitobacterium dehalogenans]|uniref:Dipeptide ABC transporter ATP-binding protein n=1 Tax=Desulfitobacterium dehalogenans TaxID=36854 RepID=A0A7C7D638_9FIRM|nr:dipeptide ABC transporter ATP-binding protein [Desulfitobacterium dehalogenans]
MTQKILEVKELTKHFEVNGGLLRKKGKVRAVENISFDLYPSETLGIVGESGSGKSTLGRLILRLLSPTAGKVFYQGQEILGLSSKDFSSIRSDLQMVFQDPYASLNPRIKIGDAIAEPMVANKKISNLKEAQEKTRMLLEIVGLRAEMYQRFPHEFSGGQRQRISIARALALEPKVLVCDEAVSALDVSVQAQILNLFNQLKKQLDLTYIFISHDLSVVKYISDRILVMYLGEVMEIAPTEELFAQTYHPYTEALISAIPEPLARSKKKRIILEGDIPSPLNPPSGCKFSTRCFRATEICHTKHPEMIEHRPGHFVRCHLYSKGKEE